MVTVRAPLSHTVAIADLRPTQITVGMHEVHNKTKHILEMMKEDGNKFKRKLVIPVVLGPKDKYYVIDHHHLCRALLEGGIEDVHVTVVLKLNKLEKDHFWVFMDNRGLVHPYDADGKRCDYDDIPKTIKSLKDDPYRSLAGALRKRGGYAKDTTPFSEFLWADFLRRQIERTKVEDHFDKALDAAYDLARHKDADFLPGWCGPVDEGD